MSWNAGVVDDAEKCSAAKFMIERSSWGKAYN